jgi:hypothetical protein
MVSVMSASAEPFAGVRVRDGDCEKADGGGDENQVAHWIASRDCALAIRLRDTRTAVAEQRNLRPIKKS